MPARIVYVTLHALEQHEARWPSAAANRDRRRQLIATEVSAAFAEGRYSSREPAFATRPGTVRRKRGKRNGGERDRTLRFTWTPSQECLYLVDKTGVNVSVITAIRPRGELGDPHVDTLAS